MSAIAGIPQSGYITTETCARMKGASRMPVIAKQEPEDVCDKLRAPDPLSNPNVLEPRGIGRDGRCTGPGLWDDGYLVGISSQL